MLKYIDSAKMGRGRNGWLDSHFHFSFAEYYNPENIHFGVLRVVNDDIVQPGEGFDTHPHRDMEILSYVVSGQLTHADSMGHRQTLSRGQVQYMSAGTGVLHSEYNMGESPLRFLQIWILPEKRDLAPNYGDFRFNLSDRNGKWLPIAASVHNTKSPAPIKIHVDVNIYATIIEAGSETSFDFKPGRQGYLVFIEGRAEVEKICLSMRDALEITQQPVLIKAKEQSHMLLIEMAQA